MTINLTHQRNPLIAWDINVSVTADKGEKITHVLVQVAGIRVWDESVIPPAGSWQRKLTQKGNYPGDNKVVVTATNDQGDDASAVDEWS